MGKISEDWDNKKVRAEINEKEIYEEPQWNENLVLQKDKQYWQILRQITQKKKRPKLIKLGMKRDIVQEKLKKFKEPWGHSLHFYILLTGKSKRNKWISRHIQPTKGKTRWI